jgi:hypothetical protein
MEPKKPGSEGEPKKPHYCGTGACPVEGVLQAELGKGGCIFCEAGVCSASALTLSMFSTATPARATVPCYRAGTRRWPPTR